MDGQGQEIRGGGAVVKNAAGFDFPKLFVGSLGRLGILTELTFKVFPQPPAFATVTADFGTLSDLLSALNAVTGSAIDLHAVDFAPAEEGWTLWVRIGGLLAALQQRAQALQAVISADAGGIRHLILLNDQDDDTLWQQARSMAWLTDGMALAKVPLTPQRIPVVEEAVSGSKVATRRYSVGGNLLWLGWPDLTAPALDSGKQDRPRDLHTLFAGTELARCTAYRAHAARDRAKQWRQRWQRRRPSAGPATAKRFPAADRRGPWTQRGSSTRGNNSEQIEEKPDESDSCTRGRRPQCAPVR